MSDVHSALIRMEDGSWRKMPSESIRMALIGVVDARSKLKGAASTGQAKNAECKLQKAEARLIAVLEEWRCSGGPQYQQLSIF
jgi:hypothetical protein